MPSVFKQNLPKWLPPLSYGVLVSAKQQLPGVDWVLVGALARDYAFRDSDDLVRLRATTDVDVAVLVTGWQEFEAAVEHLCHPGGFTRTSVAHRLLHINGQLMDILPFGGVEEGHCIAWPPSGEVKMSVLGFRDVMAASVPVALDEGVIIKIAPPAAVGFMKLVAWCDNPTMRQRDLEDISAFIRGYVTEILGWDMAFQKYGSIMGADDFDLDEAGAFILGAEIAALLSADIHAELLLLVDARIGVDSRFPCGIEENLKLSADHACRVCSCFLKGLRGTGKTKYCVPT